MNKTGVAWMILVWISQTVISCLSGFSILSVFEIMGWFVICAIFARLFYEGKNIRIIVMCLLLALIGVITHVGMWGMEWIGIEILEDTPLWNSLVFISEYTGIIICAIRGAMGKA